MELIVHNIKGKETDKKVKLDKSVFGIEPNDHAIYLDVKQYLANNRKGLHKAKERGEIVGSTRKIKKQKGTGTARAGSIKNPLFRGVRDSTHGQHNRLRAPGSIGAGSSPSRVFKGMRMAGQTGNSKVKVLNLKVVKVMSEDNILIVKGSVPGHTNSYIIVQK